MLSGTEYDEFNEKIRFYELPYEWRRNGLHILPNSKRDYLSDRSSGLWRF